VTNVTDTRGAADYTGLAMSTLEKMRVFGGGPMYLKLGRVVRYRRVDLDAWLAERLIDSTSARDPGVVPGRMQSHGLPVRP
jgi:hypothetical protein